MTNPYSMHAPGPDPAGSSAGSSGPRSDWLERTESPPRPERRTVRRSVVAALIIAALGVLMGWLWAVVSPRVLVVRTEAGFAYAEPEPEQAVAADGWFAILGVGAGLLVAVVAWFLLRRYRGAAVLIAITAGSLAAAYIAWWVGTTIGQTEFDRVRDAAAIGAQVEAPLGLRMTGLDFSDRWQPYVTGVAAAQALMAALVYTMLAAFSSHPDLRPPPARTTAIEPAPDGYHPYPAPADPFPPPAAQPPPDADPSPPPAAQPPPDADPYPPPEPRPRPEDDPP